MRIPKPSSPTEKTLTHSRKKPSTENFKGAPTEWILDGLSPDTRYFYEVPSNGADQNALPTKVPHSFVTARPLGAAFTFTVQAGSHLDVGTDIEAYQKSLAHALTAKADFHSDLGDTLMTDKYLRFTDATAHYVAQRYYLGLIGADAPIFLVQGNHDGEQPARGGGEPGSMAHWSNQTRRKYFPAPRPNNFYSGSERADE